MSDQQISVGAELARAREAAGMTTSQISDATRVRRTIIEAIEAGDLAPAGGTAYARGHIRTICSVLGLDAAPLLARLDAPTVAQETPHPVVAEQPQPTPTRSDRSLSSLSGMLAGASTRRERTGPNWSGVMAGALVLVVGVGAVQVIRSASDSAGTPPAVAGPTTSTTTSAAPDTEPTTPVLPPVQPSETPGDPDAIAQADGVNVQLSITGRASWISASTSKGTVFEGTLTKGDTKTFKDRKKIKFVFGNAGSVNLQVNGVDIGAPGEEGRVVRAAFGPGDPNQAQA